jgi:hypothetical protein
MNNSLSVDLKDSGSDLGIQPERTQGSVANSVQAFF